MTHELLQLMPAVVGNIQNIHQILVLVGLMMIWWLLLSLIVLQQMMSAQQNLLLLLQALVHRSQYCHGMLWMKEEQKLLLKERLLLCF